MSVQTVARRYASALADVVLERGEAREVQEELLAWEKMLQASPVLPEVFRNPTIPLDKKRAVLNKLIDRSKPKPTTANFLKVLLQNQRLTDLGEINQKFAEILDLRAGMVAATVTTARTVPEKKKAAWCLARNWVNSMRGFIGDLASQYSPTSGNIRDIVISMNISSPWSLVSPSCSGS